MSIFVKNVDWSQTENDVILIVPIGGRKSIDDVIIAEKFLKINVRPYYYEVFFEHPIAVDESSCKIFESNLKFRLKKANDNIWWCSLGKTSKPAQNARDDAISMEAKKELFTEYEQSVNEKCANEKKERYALKRQEMDKEMERNARIRKKIEETEEMLKNQQIKATSIDDTAEQTAIGDQIIEPEKTKDESVALPPVRMCTKIAVSLSARQFITPKRESHEQAEREWCAKQHEIMVNRIGFCDTDLNADERDLNWLIQKGNSFMVKKNFLAAASAFTCGMKTSNDSPELFLGRARAQYALGNYKRCAEDSSDALERFKPAVQLNLLERIHCFWLRGKSLISLGLADHGQRELEMAKRLDPLNFEKHESDFMNDIGAN